MNRIRNVVRDPAVRRAFRDSLPILAGYLFLGFGFGILLTEKGCPGWMAVLMAAVMYAGSGQYLGVDLIGSGAGLLTTAGMMFVLNARHFFYGLAMLVRYRDMGKAKPYLIFSLTDETFSLVCRDGAAEGVDAKRYYLTVSVLNQLYWISGCSLGAVVGTALPIDFSGIEFVMTALFLVIFLDQWKEASDHRPALAGVGGAVLCLVLFGAERFVIPAMVGILAVLLILRKRFGKEDRS